MAISVNPATRRITVPQSDLTPLGGALYQLDVDWLRQQLKDWEDSEVGMTLPDTHRHNTTAVLSGATYARLVEIINGYTLEFQTTGTPYTVSCTGANHNLADVFIPGSSGVSLIIGNSAGLVQISTGSGLSTAQDQRLTLIEKLLRNKQITDPVTGKLVVYDDDNTNILVQGDLFEDAAGSQAYRGQGAERRERLA
jgi:hypothetical protein